MSKCQICHDENAPAAQRCASCGAWLDVPASSDESSGDGSALAASTRSTSTPPTPDDPLEAAVVDLMRNSRKIDAIKRYREATGKGLKESKEEVEEIARRYGVASHSGGIGCGASLIAAAAVLGGMLFVAGQLIPPLRP